MCIFCDIIDHKIPSSVVYEDDEVLAILDISQVTFGHTLVMPKKHVDSALEADPETIARVFSAASVLGKKIKEKTGAVGVNLLANCGEAAGQTVPHMHVHVIPRYGVSDAIDIAFHPSEKKDLSEVFEKING